MLYLSCKYIQNTSSSSKTNIKSLVRMTSKTVLGFDITLLISKSYVDGYTEGGGGVFREKETNTSIKILQLSVYTFDLMLSVEQ